MKKELKSEKKDSKKKEIKSTKKVDKKNTKKDSKKIESVNNKEWKTIVKVAIWVIAIFGFFYLLTFILVGDYGTGKKDDNTEATIQYDEILAGASFSMNAPKYLVVYYDTTEENASEILNAIYTYQYSNEESLTLYTVHLSNSLNKYAVNEKSNKNPTKASELAINGPTIIRFRDGNVREYIEGFDKVVDYLK